MTKMTSKVLASSLVILTALGLAGCTNSAQAPTSKQTATSTKVSKHAVKESPSTKTSTSGRSSSAPTSAGPAVTSSLTSASSPASVNAASPQATRMSQPTATSSSAIVSSASQAANSASPSQDHLANQQVLASFVQTSGVQQKGNRYIVTPSKQDSGNYQVEVRNNQGGDPNVAHLTGLYQYNPSTNQIQQMNPITGNYHN